MYVCVSFFLPADAVEAASLCSVGEQLSVNMSESSLKEGSRGPEEVKLEQETLTALVGADENGTWCSIDTWCEHVMHVLLVCKWVCVQAS